MWHSILRSPLSFLVESKLAIIYKGTCLDWAVMSTDCNQRIPDGGPDQA